MLVCPVLAASDKVGGPRLTMTKVAEATWAMVTARRSSAQFNSAILSPGLLLGLEPYSLEQRAFVVGNHI